MHGSEGGASGNRTFLPLSVPSDLKTFQASEITPEERSAMLSDNVSTVVRVLENYHSALENDGVPHIFALQPLLYLSKKPRNEIEEKIEATEEHQQYYDMSTADVYKFIIDTVKLSSDKKGYILVDFSDYFDQTSEWVFTDWCHLTSGANYLIAKQLSNVIKSAIFKRPLTEGDKVDDISSFFWNLTVTSNVLYAPEPDNDKNGVANILTGYPSYTLYSSKSFENGERQDITLDLQEEFKMSRMKIVWGDKDSVPEKWAVDISTDNENWVPWINGDNKSLDNFSLWPAYEYYGAEPVEARYLRYKPIDNENRPIRLRSLSAYR